MADQMGESKGGGGQHVLPSANYSQGSQRPASASNETRKPMNRTHVKKNPNEKGGGAYIATKLRVYPTREEVPEPRPMTETNKCRVERVQNKQYMLRQQFMGREQYERPASKGEKPIVYKSLPPYWSQQVHGEPGENIELPAELHTEQPLTSIKRSLKCLRDSLATIPWANGQKVDDAERRIRAELNDLEDHMRNHVARIVERIYSQCKAPAMTPKGILMRAFERLEFADVWNDPDKGLHLMVPVFMHRGETCIDSEHTIVEVKIKKRIPMGEALLRWRNCSEFPLWGGQSDGVDLKDLEDPNGKLLLRPKEVLVAHAAGLFMKHGFDGDGLMPYEVFCSVLFTKPNRLLGMEPLKDLRAKGKHGFYDKADFGFDGKILYQRAKNSVFPPSDFKPETAERSRKMPTASLKLEYAYGYSGQENLANNLFYTDNPEEIVYFTAALGVVMNTVTNTQRFFFGHNDNIKCMNIHPNDWIVATGQTKKVGPEEVPFVCIWETRECKELQRLHHPFNSRAIIACAFSPNGESLVTVGADNAHSVFVWKWMTDPEKKKYVLGQKVDDRLLYHWPKKISGCGFGPEKKIPEMKKDPEGIFYKYANTMVGLTDKENLPVSESADRICERPGFKYGVCPSGNLYVPPAPEGETIPPPPAEDKPASSRSDPEAWMKGKSFELDPPEVFNAANGAPPQVFGIVWNPFSENEFITYGVKHLNLWSYGPDEANPHGPYRWIKTAGTFSSGKVMNVLAAAFVPDCMEPHREMIRDKDSGKIFNKGHAKVTKTGKIIRYHRDPHDDDVVIAEEYVGNMREEPTAVSSTVLFTGFPTGEVGIWIKGILMRTIQAHAPGPKVIEPDGMVTHGGVRVVKLRGDKTTLLTGGADGHINAWDVSQTVADQEWMTEIGARKELHNKGDHGAPELLRSKSTARRQEGSALQVLGKDAAGHSAAVLGRGAVKIRKLPGCWKLKSPFKEESAPAFRALDSVKGKNTFIAGTNKNEIWELYEGGDAKPLVQGATADLYTVATHPRNPHVFATATDNSIVRVWNTKDRTMERCMSVGWPCRSVCFSADGSHLAVGGKFGELCILTAGTLHPLVTFKDCVSSIDEIKYSPNNRIMACGSHDLYIDCYDTGFRDGKTGKTVSHPLINKVWAKDHGGKGQYTKLCRCVGHSASVCHIDFSLPEWNPPIPELRGKTLLRSECNGYEALLWDPMTGKQILANPRNCKWATRTTLLGFDVMGIWPDGALTSDVNTLDRSNSQEYCITGDNYSLLKLFNYPVVHDDAPFREYYGGASFITCARFTSDDRRVIVVGGNDRTIFQYITHGMNWEDANMDTRSALATEVVEDGWCDVDECFFCDRKPLPPPLPPPWGPLDKEGKTWGLCDVRNGKCSCANHELHMKQEFKNYDVDGDGQISDVELKLVMEHCGYRMSLEKAGKLLKEADKDGNGGLTYEEFVPFWLERMEMESLRKVMGKLREELKKKDRDGNINEHELMRVLQACGYEVPEEDMAKIMKDADKSGDGQINHDEFVKFWVHKVELDALENIAEQMRHDFKRYDHDEKGNINIDEIKKVTLQEMHANGHHMTSVEADAFLVKAKVECSSSDAGDKIVYEKYLSYWLSAMQKEMANKLAGLEAGLKRAESSLIKPRREPKVLSAAEKPRTPSDSKPGSKVGSTATIVHSADEVDEEDPCAPPASAVSQASYSRPPSVGALDRAGQDVKPRSKVTSRASSVAADEVEDTGDVQPPSRASGHVTSRSQVGSKAGSVTDKEGPPAPPPGTAATSRLSSRAGSQPSSRAPSAHGSARRE